MTSYATFRIAKTIQVLTVMTLVFLKLMVAGHLTIYVSCIPRWFWMKPWRNLRLFLTTDARQIIGTLIAIYGVSAAPVG
ncbi:hypothetical protein ACEWPL_016175 [Roseovarius sp. S1116L3]|uniref:hypothetical protein n=1 Tax=Roseovarius roseus TaxID=3342636 RepID=UPI003729FE00